MVRELLTASCANTRQNFVTECRDGYSLGKLIRYEEGTDGTNYSFNVTMKSASFGGTKDCPYYSKNGKAVKALNADWKEYSEQLKGYDEPE